MPAHPEDTLGTETATSPSGQPILRMERISKRWPRQSAAVLDAVGFEALPGTLTWIGGRNGAGKTTLLRIAAGLIRPDAGSVRFGSLEPERDRRDYQRQIGFLSAAGVGLYARLTVRRHLDYWSRIAMVPRATRTLAQQSSLTSFGLEELADRRVDRLSTGQRQRVRLAMTFLHDPSMLLLDEPRNHLDDESTDLLLSVVRERCAAGALVLWCSPSADQVTAAADRAVVVEDGRVEEQ